MTTARVEMWGTLIGAVSWDEREGLARFEYDPDFRRSGIQLAPLHMPLGDRVYAFPALRRTSFDGLPGMLADALPDRFLDFVNELGNDRFSETREDILQHCEQDSKKEKIYEAYMSDEAILKLMNLRIEK